VLAITCVEVSGISSTTAELSDSLNVAITSVVCLASFLIASA
jgi:hypothetical protein